MPSFRPPISKSKKIRRAPFFYVVTIGLPIAAAGIASGWGISTLVKSRRAWIERSGRAVAQMRLRYSDLRSRHPDYPPGEAALALEEFFTLRLPRQGRDLDKATALLAEARGQHAALAGAGAATAEGLKTFSPNGFRDFYDALELGDVTAPVEGTPMTGDGPADARITRLALARGYRPRPVADESLLVREAHYQMHPAALAAFHALADTARREGYELAVVSSYRSIDRQRTNFVARIGEIALELRGRAVRFEELASGGADDVIERVLSKNAIPGYSKHHTGYTTDITDLASGREFTDFGETDAFRWLSADNYAVAKRFGFIPSYPQGATLQGPDPEPWEYVWVGVEVLREEW